MNKYDVVVIGLGAMGSASAYQLAKQGATVLGIDQFTPPHVFGSSHGETRITRQAIAEGEEYVPLVLRANELWREIEQEISEQLYVQTDILIMASNAANKQNAFVNNTVKAARAYGIGHEELDAHVIKQRFPQFNLRGDEKGYYEPGAGYLKAEVCVKAQLQLAEKYGAKLHYGEKFTGYQQKDGHVVVRTDKAEYTADKLVLMLGPWVHDVLPQELKPAIRVYRQVLYWFEIAGDSTQFIHDNFPVFNWEFNANHEDFMYGFPTLDGKSVKVATEQYNVTTTPENVDRTVSSEEMRVMYEQYIRPNLPGLKPNCLRAEACLYTVAPNWRFMIDYVPGNPNVILASPCSGHGFKHSAAIGEVVAAMAQGTAPKIDIRKFAISRV
ncbi:MAG TPA: N-methyl-L-tryptophan oxidase, partial [Candidatus Saccharimonadales bacterium]|nr:N-methyl-L-tryptophan oxidase [Candidatus Saccharimonadales bacterium]